MGGYPGVLVPSGCYDKVHGLGGLETIEITFSESRRLED